MYVVQCAGPPSYTALVGGSDSLITVAAVCMIMPQHRSFVVSRASICFAKVRRREGNATCPDSSNSPAQRDNLKNRGWGDTVVASSYLWLPSY